MTAPNGSSPSRFDLAEAAAAEVAAVPFAFTYKGKDYELPPMSGWPMTSVRAVATGDLEGALSELIGPDTYEGMCEDGLTLGELGALFRAAGATGGMATLPNSRRPVRRGSTRTSRR